MNRQGQSFATFGEHLQVVEELSMGRVNCTSVELDQVCYQASALEFTPETYDLLRNNCNHFVQSMLDKFGTERTLPSYVNRTAKFAEVIW